MLKLFFKTLGLQGYRITDAISQYELWRGLSNTDFEQFQKKQLQKIVAHHTANTAFYKNFALSETSFNDLPILQKKDLQRPLTERLSNGYTLKNCYVGKTSGSSGHPFYFAKDKFCHALDWAAFATAYKQHNIAINNDLQARFYGIPLETIAYGKERLKDFCFNRYRFPIFNLNDKQLQQITQHFKHKPFKYINGYTSSIVLFARYLFKNNIVLTDICPTLTHCIVTSEMLFEQDKSLLERAFGVPVLNEYGASEVGLIAFQNSGQKMVINNQNLHLEVLDQNNKPVPKGLPGKIVVTALHNYAHPFIRFEIGDLGVIAPSSTPLCTVLQNLEGRISDIARLPNGKVVPGLTFYYVTKKVITPDSCIKEFVICQTQINTFEINYVASQPLSRKQKHEIQNAVNTYVAEGLIIKFNQKEFIKREKSGKLKQFSSIF